MVSLAHALKSLMANIVDNESRENKTAVTDPENNE